MYHKPLGLLNLSHFFVYLAEGYLKHMGNAVADFLQPFGIDVDINVEHKGNREKCTGSQQSTDGDPPKGK